MSKSKKWRRVIKTYIKVVSGSLAIGLAFSGWRNNSQNLNLLFWSAALIYMLVQIVDPSQVAQRLWRSVSTVGLLCNAAVMTANKGNMPFYPVFGINTPKPGYILANGSCHLLWLCDRFWGFSIGDFIIITGIVIAITGTIRGLANDVRSVQTV